MKTKLTTKIICLVACMAMLVGSTLCVSAEETNVISKVIYQKADDTSVWMEESEIPAVGSNGLPLYRKEYPWYIGDGAYANVVQEVSSITPGGVYIYGGWARSYTPEQIALIHSLVDGAGITNGMSKYEKAVRVNNAVCAALTYGGQGEIHADGIYAIQGGGVGVCAHYADLYQTLCQAVGIDCQIISGMADGAYTGSHAWNVMSINGTEYFVDTTWNDCLGKNAYLMAEQDFAKHTARRRSTDPDEIESQRLWHQFRPIQNYSPEYTFQDYINDNIIKKMDTSPEALKEAEESLRNWTGDDSITITMP